MDGLVAGIQFNDVVVIAGCGPIGLGMIAAAKMKNPKSIIALGKEIIFLYVNHLNLLTYIEYLKSWQSKESVYNNSVAF